MTAISIRPVAKTARLLWARSSEAKLGLISAGVAFFGFLAVFPAVAAIITIWGFGSDPEVVRGQLFAVRDFLPAEAFRLLDAQVQALIAANDGSFGVATLLPTLFALWSARAGVDALIQGLDAAYGTTQRQGFGHVIRAIILTATLVGVALVSVLAAVIVPLLLAVLPLPIGSETALWIQFANQLAGVAVVIFGLGLAYRYGPNHAIRQVPRILPGLLLATVLWALASRGFMIYLTNFGSYNQIYGSIGAVVALLMWFWLSAYAVLLGAALNAVMPRPGQ